MIRTLYRVDLDARVWIDLLYAAARVGIESSRAESSLPDQTRPDPDKIEAAKLKLNLSFVCVFKNETVVCYILILHTFHTCLLVEKRVKARQQLFRFRDIIPIPPRILLTLSVSLSGGATKAA